MSLNSLIKMLFNHSTTLMEPLAKRKIDLGGWGAIGEMPLPKPSALEPAVPVKMKTYSNAAMQPKSQRTFLMFIQTLFCGIS